MKRFLGCLFAVLILVFVFTGSAHAYSKSWGWISSGLIEWDSEGLILGDIGTNHDANASGYTPYYTPTSAYAGPMDPDGFEDIFGYGHRDFEGQDGALSGKTAGGNAYSESNGYRNAGAFAGDWIPFTYAGAGPVTFSMSYFYSINVEAHPNGFADGYVFMDLGLNIWDPSQGMYIPVVDGGGIPVGDYVDSGMFVDGGEPAYYDGGSGTLSFTFTPDPGVMYAVGSGANGYFAAEAVPVPAAVWLLGSGLVGLFGLRRKMQR